MSRTTEPDLSRVAAAIGEPARAAMLAALLGGEWLPAGELARRAGISPPTASGHLTRLVAAGLVARRVAGRRREYALAGRDVAAALEALARIAPQRVGAAGERASGGRSAVARASSEQALRFARTCYDHLAGRLGVLLTDTLAARGLIPASCHDVTPRGEEWLRGLGIDVEALRRARRTFARPCLDWSERRDHLAGAVGAALAATMLERRWLARIEGTRALRLTVRGREGLYRALGLEVEPGPAAGR